MGDRKVVGLLLDLLTVLKMKWRWRFLVSYHWFLTWNIWRKFYCYNTLERTGIHTHSNWCTSTRVINWSTTRNVRSVFAWHSIRVKVGTTSGCWVVKWRVVPIGFKLFNTVDMYLLVYNFIILLFFHLGLKL